MHGRRRGRLGIRGIGVIGVLAAASRLLVADTFFVPQDFPTIQAAIDFASDGDTVIIQSGTYNERFDTLGKRIDVNGVAVNPPIIDGTGLTSPVISVGPASGQVGLTNLTVRNADGILGGALLVGSGANVFIRNVDFRDNRSISGGAVAVGLNASLVIRDSLFFRNEATSDGGGMLVLNGADVVIEDTTFSQNIAGDDGGAISVFGADIEVRGGSIPEPPEQMVANGAVGNGGAIALEGGASAVMTGYYLGSNDAGENGGAVSVIGSTFDGRDLNFDGGTAVGTGGGLDARDGASVEIRGALFRANEAISGGGIALFESDLIANQTLFIGNVAENFGGGLFVSSINNRAEAIVDTSYFDVNEADFGAAVRVASSGPFGSTPQAVALFSNSEFWSNTATTPFGSGGISALEFSGGGIQTIVEVINCTLARNRGGSQNGLSGTGAPRFDVENTIIWDNNGPGIVGDPSRITTRHSIFPEIATFVGSGNFFADPMFDDIDRGFLDLLPGSPAIDAGRNASVAPDLTDRDEDGDIFEPTPLDASRFTRISDDPLTPDSGSGSGPIVDIGANEFPRVCAADITAPFGGGPTFFDISGFLALFNAGDSAADIAAPFGTLNFFDISAYLALFNTPCP